MVVDEVRKSKSNYGCNADSGEYGDLVGFGIVDPTKVIPTALQNAASIAGMMITTEALVTEIPEKEKAPAMPPGGGMGGVRGSAVSSPRSNHPAGGFRVLRLEVPCRNNRLPFVTI